MFIERLTDEEIKEIVEPLIEKYNLRKSSLNPKLFNLTKHDECYEIVISKYTNERGPVTTHNIEIFIYDFDFFADLYEEEEINCKKDYLKQMYARFGLSYKYELNKSLEERKQTILKEQAEELDEDITDVMESLR